MRLAIILVALGSLLPLAALYPHVGLMLWGWLTMMQPHQEVWGLPAWLQLNLITAIATIGFWLISREPKFPRASALPVLLVLLLISTAVSQLYSLDPGYSWPLVDRDLRVLAFVILCLIMLRSQPRIHAMLWILIISIGYHSALGGAFTLATGGQFLVLGPKSTMIADNNHAGLAFVTILPLMNYLRLQSKYFVMRIGISIVMVLTVFAVFGTHSRGALVAFMAMAIFFLLKTRSRIVAAIAVILVAASAITFMSERWDARMQTIAGYEEDDSFQGRVDAWTTAYEIAVARPLIGAGRRTTYLQDVVDPYISEPRKARAAHSIYFELLGSNGFPGLIILLLILLVTWRDLRRIEKASRNLPNLRWASDFAAMSQVSLLAFMVGGAALSLEYWEGFWLVVVLTNCTLGVILTHLAKDASPPPLQVYRPPVTLNERIGK